MRVTSDDCAGASARHVLPPVPWLILITLELDFVVSVDLGGDSLESSSLAVQIMKYSLIAFRRMRKRIVKRRAWPHLNVL